MLELNRKYKPKNKKRFCGCYDALEGEYIIFTNLSLSKKTGRYDIYRKNKVIDWCRCLNEENLVPYEKRTVKKLNSY